MTLRSHATASLDVRLFFWWDSLPPGRAVTMSEMVTAMGVSDPQAIRNALTRLRKGRGRDPSSKGHLRPLPVRHNAGDSRYYDLSKVTGDNVAAQIPARILSDQFREILTRALTVQSAMGRGGLAVSAEQYLGDDDLRKLIGQIKVEEAWQVHGTFLEIAKARDLLDVASLRGLFPPDANN